MRVKMRMGIGMMKTRRSKRRMSPAIIKCQTFNEYGGESFLLHRSIWHEPNIQFVGSGMHVVWNAISAIFSNQRRVFRVAVTHFYVVVHAVVVVLHLECKCPTTPVSSFALGWIRGWLKVNTRLLGGEYEVVWGWIWGCLGWILKLIQF